MRSRSDLRRRRLLHVASERNRRLSAGGGRDVDDDRRSTRDQDVVRCMWPSIRLAPPPLDMHRTGLPLAFTSNASA